MVLRGDENLYANENSEEHADIDLLVENYQNAIFLMNGEQLYKFPIRPKVLVTINNRGFIFDLWDANLKYHSRAWHESMLENRVKKDFYYYLDIENDFYSRIYHCLIHKNKTAKDYYLYFENRFKGLGLEKKYDLSSYKNPMDLYYLLLLNYMKAHQYEFLKEEKDWHCFYNERVVNIEKAQCFIEKQCNIMDIVPYMVDYNSDSGYTYFKGLFNGKCVFVKYGGIGDSCQNEFHMTSKAYNASPDHFLPVRFHYFDETHKFIIYDYLECKSIEDYLLNTSIKERESVGKQIEEIYYTLYDINIVHRDIRPDNFVVTKDGKVILLDLQFAIDIENGNELNCLKNNKKIALRLGDIYRFEKYAWNDTYSFKETCNKIGVDLKFTKGEKNRIVKMPFFQIIKFKFENLKEIIWGGAKIIKYYNKKIWIKSYCEFYKKSAKGSR